MILLFVAVISIVFVIIGLIKLHKNNELENSLSKINDSSESHEAGVFLRKMNENKKIIQDLLKNQKSIDATQFFGNISVSSVVETSKNILFWYNPSLSTNLDSEVEKSKKLEKQMETLLSENNTLQDKYDLKVRHLVEKEQELEREKQAAQRKKDEERRKREQEESDAYRARMAYSSSTSSSSDYSSSSSSYDSGSYGGGGGESSGGGGGDSW